MSLNITLVKSPRDAVASQANKTLTSGGLTIGRGNSNTWVLPDPDKFLSSCHCEILIEGSEYFLCDLSTNGTFLNKSPEPLGKGTKARLKTGDVFDIGDYRFAVEVLQNSPFGGVSPSAIGDSSSADPLDFFAKTSPSEISSIDDIFGSASSGSEFKSPFSSSDDPFGSNKASAGFNSSSIDDPLLALGGAEDRGQRVAQPPQFSGLKGDGLDDIFGASSAGSDAGGFEFGQVNANPGMDEAFSLPSSVQENVIPEDWEDDLLGKSPVASSQLAPQGKPSFAKPDPFADALVPLANPQKSNLPPFIPEVNDSQINKADSLESLLASAPPKPQPAIAPRVPPVSERVNEVVNAQPRNVQGAAVSGNNKLIDAMGLDSSRMTPAEMDDINQMAGEMIREVVEGMLQVLRSRASIKNEFRMNVTTIQPVENNPLKFSVNVDDALENMFVKKSNAFKKPVEAFREGFQELGEHQIAMIAGIRHGFEQMFTRFNPTELEKHFNRQGKGGGIPGMQKVKYWTSYSDFYARYVDNMDASFQQLFGSDFVNAYEDQLRKLKATRKKKAHTN